ncbi:MAG: hypothetical protein ABIF92_01665 [archaeon]
MKRNVLPKDCTPNNTVLVVIEPFAEHPDGILLSDPKELIDGLLELFKKRVRGVFSFYHNSKENLAFANKVKNYRVIVDVLNKSSLSAEYMLSSDSKYILICGRFMGGCLSLFLNKYSKVFKQHSLLPVFLARYIEPKHPKYLNILFHAHGSFFPPDRESTEFKNAFAMRNDLSQMNYCKRGKSHLFLSRATMNDLLEWADEN